MAVGAVAGGLIVAAIIAAQRLDLGNMTPGLDAQAYWLAGRTAAPYGGGGEGVFGAYLYSPAFSQILTPLLNLPWAQFMAIWTLLLMFALLALVGPVLFALALPLAFFELWGGNIHLLLALAIVVGFRYPATWSLVLLTKVTPGVGLLWFAVRREWRHLAVAVGTTTAIAGASWLIDPGNWSAWIALLVREAGRPASPGSIELPLVLRLAAAALLVSYGALADRRSLVPLAAWIALPNVWLGSVSLLIAVVALERARLEEIVLGALDRLIEMAFRRRGQLTRLVRHPQG